MGSIVLILIEFMFRMCLGISLAMAVTPARYVTSGFYRVHLWVIMGLATFGGLMIYSSMSAAEAPAYLKTQLYLAIAIAVVSYIGAVIWMYEASRAGVAALLIVSLLSLVAMLAAVLKLSAAMIAWQMLDRITGSFVVGLVTTAMLLGHWYLNTPGMRLEPLRQLLILLALAILLRMLFSGAGLIATYAVADSAPPLTQSWIAFLSLRWIAGLLATLGLTWLTWLTLKIPNTQSATGILYAGVILALIGELTSQLMSAQNPFPL